MAAGIARTWVMKYPWLTDCFLSAAGEELWKLATTYGHLAEFPGFVRKGVRWAILHRLRAERVHNPLAFDQRPAPTEPDAEELLDLLADDAPDVGASLEVRDELAALLARAELTPRQRELFTRHVGGGERLGDLAAEQGVSRSRVGHVIAAALGKLRTAAR